MSHRLKLLVALSAAAAAVAGIATEVAPTPDAVHTQTSMIASVDNFPLTPPPTPKA